MSLCLHFARKRQPRRINFEIFSDMMIEKIWLVGEVHNDNIGIKFDPCPQYTKVRWESRYSRTKKASKRRGEDGNKREEGDATVRHLKARSVGQRTERISDKIFWTLCTLIIIDTSQHEQTGDRVRGKIPTHQGLLKHGSIYFPLYLMTCPGGPEKK